MTTTGSDVQTILKPRLDMMDLDEILDDHTNPPPAIIGDGILLKKTLLLVYGQPKSKKTFLTLAFALGIASGKSFARFKIPEARKVMHISAEGGYFPTRNRIQIMARSLGDPKPKNFRMCLNSKINLVDTDHVAELDTKICDFKPDVLVIDPLSRHHSCEENSATEMAHFFGNIRDLMERHHMSVILVHHSGKDEMKQARGSSVITAEYDSSIHLKSMDDKTTSLEFDMRHVETPEPWHLKFNSKTLLFERVIDDQVALLLSQHGGPLAKSDLAKLLVSEGIFETLGGAYKAIDRARSCELIVESDGKFMSVS